MAIFVILQGIARAKATTVEEETKATLALGAADDAEAGQDDVIIV